MNSHSARFFNVVLAVVAFNLPDKKMIFQKARITQLNEEFVDTRIHCIFLTISLTFVKMSMFLLKLI